MEQEKNESDTSNQDNWAQVAVIQPVTDARLAGYLALSSWTPYVGALLVSGTDPHTNAGVPTEFLTSLQTHTHPQDRLTEAAGDELEWFAPEYFENPRRIVGLWRSKRTPQASVPPIWFLAWCKHWGVIGIDLCLERVKKMPAFNAKLMSLLESKNLRSRCPPLYRPMFEDSMGKWPSTTPNLAKKSQPQFRGPVAGAIDEAILRVNGAHDHRLVWAELCILASETPAYKPLVEVVDNEIKYLDDQRNPHWLTLEMVRRRLKRMHASGTNDHKRP